MMTRTLTAALAEVLEELLGEEPTAKQLDHIEVLAQAGKLRSLGEFLRSACSAQNIVVGDTTYRIEKPACSLKIKGERPCILRRSIIAKISEPGAIERITEAVSLDDSEGDPTD